MYYHTFDMFIFVILSELLRQTLSTDCDTPDWLTEILSTDWLQYYRLTDWLCQCHWHTELLTTLWLWQWRSFTLLSWWLCSSHYCRTVCNRSHYRHTRLPCRLLWSPRTINASTALACAVSLVLSTSHIWPRNLLLEHFLMLWCRFILLSNLLTKFTC